jgi:cytidylate kinase
MSKKITVAIDGFSSCGKSTLAKALAKKLGYGYVDSGAMYRAVTLYFLGNGVPLDDETAVRTALDNIEIHFENDGSGNRTFLNGKDVENEIRQMPVSESVSPVAAISAVRRAMVRQQQQLGRRKGIVMDGRDIGTVVFPDAELKIFLTADPEVRVMRRYNELKDKGLDVDLDLVRLNLMERDRIDSTRDDSPLRQADDAIVLDNSHLSPSEQLDIAFVWAKEKIEAKQGIHS